jgi:hypothetical protein
MENIEITCESQYKPEIQYKYVVPQGSETRAAAILKEVIGPVVTFAPTSKPTTHEFGWTDDGEVSLIYRGN